MSAVKHFTLTEDEYAEVLDASKSTPYMVVGGSTGSSPQESVNLVWKRLAEKYGVVWDSIRPFGTDPRDLVATELPPKLGRAVNIVLAPVEGTPSYTFVEVEYDDGRSLKLGTWVTHKANDGLSCIRITAEDFAAAIAGEAVAK